MAGDEQGNDLLAGLDVFLAEHEAELIEFRSEVETLATRIGVDEGTALPRSIVPAGEPYVTALSVKRLVCPRKSEGASSILNTIPPSAPCLFGSGKAVIART